MRIIELRADNFKRLRCVEIVPGPDGLVTIGGNNEQGKSSVLDAIQAALGGKDSIPEEPVRAGEESAIIRLDLGTERGIQYRVTRTFNAEGRTTSLKLENAEGARYGQEQTRLNDLVGAISFDPSRFAHLKPEEQAAELLAIVPLAVDLDELAEADKVDYAERTAVNRDVRALQAQVDAIVVPPAPEGDVPDLEALLATVTNASAHNAQVAAEQRRRGDRWGVLEMRQETARLRREEAEQARQRAIALDKEAEGIEAECKAEQEALDALPPLDAEVDAAQASADYQAAQALARQHQAHAQAADQRKALQARLDQAKAESDARTKALEKRAQDRADALAEAEMPVDGLSIGHGEDGKPFVTFNGVPFTQASTAVKLKVGTAIAMAANPTLRIALLRDGAFLDENSLAMLSEMAAEESFQLWVERVGEGGVGIVMEDGAVKGAPVLESVAPKPRKRKAEAEPEAAQDQGDKAEGALL